MLPKKSRLTKSHVEYVFKKGGKLNDRHFAIRYLHRKEGQNQYCVIVSLKVSTKTTERNTLRRKIYEAIKKNAPPQKHISIVVIAKKSALDLSFEEITDQLNRLFTKIHE